MEKTDPGRVADWVTRNGGVARRIEGGDKHVVEEVMRASERSLGGTKSRT